MKVIGLISIFVLSAICVAAQNMVTSIADFKGMAGCWERNDKVKSLLVSEQWMKPAGTSMLGMGRTVKNGKTADYEFMRIEQRSDGIYFISKPMANSEETAFKMKSLEMHRVVFENPTHDFPQRIIYNFGKPGRLAARIEGNNNGKFMGIDFPLVRAKCA